MPQIKGPSGPWFVGAMNDALFIINEPPRPVPTDYINTSLKTKVIATLSEPHHEGWTYEEYKAHAYLLAAAPELLEALKEANSVACAETCDYVLQAKPLHTKECLKVQAIIAKAEGRS